MLPDGEDKPVLMYVWTSHWINMILWVTLLVNKKNPFRNAEFSSRAIKGEFGGLWIVLKIRIHLIDTIIRSRGPP